MVAAHTHGADSRGVIHRVAARVAAGALVITGAAAGVVGMAGAASAHTPAVTSTCTTLTVDLKDYVAPHNGDATPNHVTVTVDGQQQLDQDYATAFSRTFDYANSFVSNSYDVQVTAWDDPADVNGNGAHGFTHHFVATVDSCPSTVVHPTKPDINQAQCTGHTTSTPFFTIPDITGIRYVDGAGSTLAAGRHDAVPGSTVHVAAVALSGYAIAANDQHEWDLVFSAIDCNTVVTIPVAPSFTPAPCTGPGQVGLGSITVTPVTGVVYTVDGTPVTDSIAKGPGTYDVVATALPGFEISGVHEWSVTIPARDCTVTIFPIAPKVTQATCTGTTPSAPTYTIPDTAGVDYFVGAAATATPPGTYAAAPGSTLDITAKAQPGYALAAAAPSVFHLVFDAAPDCSTHVTVVTPSVTQGRCTGPGSTASGYITIPTTAGVIYEIDGVLAVAGNHDEAPGTYLVTAVPGPGVTIDGVASWHLVVDDTPACVVEVVPATPALTNAQCVGGDTFVPASYTIPATTGIDYFVDGQLTSAGKHVAAAGTTAKVTAAAQAGYVLTAGATDTWELVFAKAPTCVLGEKVTKTPKTPTPPSLSVLPFTGAPTGLLVLLGLVAAGAGGALVTVGRRRTWPHGAGYDVNKT
jgi:hypothetical protein